MSEAPEYHRNKATVAQISAHLRACDDAFVPPLSARLDIDDYAARIADRSERFEAWVDGELIGLVATYCNDHEGGRAFITSVSVMKDWQGQGLASELVARCVGYVRGLGFARIELEVNERNRAALDLYAKHGFSASGDHGTEVIMSLNI